MKLFNSIKSKKMFKNNLKSKKGFSLIELILVMSISTIAFIGILNMEQRKVQIQNAENAGAQYVELGQALSNYIVRESTFLTANIPVDTTVVLPIDALRNATGSYNGYPAHQYLPKSFNDTSLLNTNLVLRIRKNSSNILYGLILSSSPIVDSSNAVRYDLMGAAIKRMGPQGGMTFPSATVLSGLGGQWQLTNADFSEINAIGLLGYRVQYQGDYDSSYLRLDGKYPMQGNLDMGNYNIKNATDISYNGWLYGNNAILNNLITGNITNTGNIQTFSINGTTTNNVANAVSNATSSGTPAKSYANFDYMYTPCINCGLNNEGASSSLPVGAPGEVRIGSTGNSGLLLVRDIVLGANSSKGDLSQTALSDRLPRYVDRGIINVTHGQILPMPQINLVAKNTVSPMTGYVCNYYGGTVPTAKVELVPQNFTMESPIQSASQSVFSGINAYAVESGQNWIIHLEYPSGSAAPLGTLASAHVYCDYGV